MLLTDISISNTVKMMKKYFYGTDRLCMYKVNNKDTRKTPMASFWCLYCYILTYFTPCSSVSIVNFEHNIYVQNRMGYSSP